MNRLFISYRRDDSAGHAGRLQDSLAARLGADCVFMDVSDLRPGQDYVAELDRALADADCVLVVIGPRWLAAVNASGQRRIDDPDDLVCREISAGLSQQVMVIPVLVHGAAMPAADALPLRLRPLVRRQAITLTDQRWDSDVDDLARLLSADDAAGAGMPAKPVVSGGVRRVAPVALLALAVTAGGAWTWWWIANRSQQPTVTASPAATAGERVSPPLARTDADNPVAAPGKSVGAPPQRFAIALPQVSEVRFRSHRAQVSFAILALRQEARPDGMHVLTVRLRVTTRGPLDEMLSSSQFRLISGEREVAPTTAFHGTVEPNAAKETTLDFVLPAAPVEPLLEVRFYAESTRIPIVLSARTALAKNDPSLDDFGQPRRRRVVDAISPLPATLAAGQRVDVGTLSYQIVDAVIERETVEKASLAITVRCSVPRGSGGTNFGSSTVRLWIDGVPRAPVNSVNEAVYAGDSKDARFVFDLLFLPQTLEVGIFQADKSAKMALSLAPLPRR